MGGQVNFPAYRRTGIYCLYLSVTEGTATIKTDSSAMENAMMMENAMEMVLIE